MYLHSFLFTGIIFLGGLMKYIIMCSGKGTRWNNYMGIPKHLVEINGETLLERTTKILKKHNIEYVITSSDERYAKYGNIRCQTCSDCEIDRFEESLIDGDICYLYGDVYYTEEALDTIINTDTEDITFFGSEVEIFAIKIKDIKLFLKHKHIVKDLYINKKIDRCIGWEVYRSLHNIPFNEHIISERYIKILDETDDIDYPEDYERFIKERTK